MRALARTLNLPSLLSKKSFLFQITVTVTNPRDGARTFQEKFWVDTGALYTFVPEDRLEQIGIVPLRTGNRFLPMDGMTDAGWEKRC